MNDLLSYVIESFFDSRQEKLNQLNTPEKLKSSDVVEYVRSNMKGSKTKQGAFLREGALYFLNAMAKEGGALDRGKPGTVAPGYAFEGGKREYGRVRGDSPLRKLQRPLIVPDVDYPGVPDSRLQDVVVAEALALFRAWSNRNKPRFFDYKLSKPMTGDSTEVEELMELYRNHNRRFMRIHQLVAENNDTQPIYFDNKKGKLPIGTEGIQTGITITRPPQAMWICLKLRKKAGASWTMYTNSVAKLGSMLNRAGMPSMVSTYGKLWDLWTILPDEMSAPDAYDTIGAIDGISRVGRTTKGVAFRSFLMDSVLIDESTFSNNTSIFPLSLHIHHGESKVATLQEGEGNQDFTKDTGLSMIPATGTLAQFDVGIDNHPLQAMYNAPDLVARVYRFARTAQIIPQLQAGLPTIEIDSEPSNLARQYFTSLKQMDGGEFYEGELKQIPEGRDITIEFDGEKAYLKGFPNDRKLTNLIQTEEFEQLCDKPATAFARIGGKDANALTAFISQLDPSDFDERRVKEAFQDRILTIWGLSSSLTGEPFAPISDVSGRFIRATKQAKPDDVEEMLAVSPEGLIGTVEPSEDRKEEKLIFGERTTPVVVLGYEKASVQNQEARVIIVGKVVEEVVDILVPGVRKPTRKAGKERREQYQEVARVGAFSGFNYDDRKDLLAYMESLNYQREHEGDILIDPVEANIIFEMSYKGLLADKQMWRYNRTGKSKEVGVKQDLPAGGERFVKGVKTRFIMEPKEKNAIAQYNNPKIIGYRSEMGREEQRIYPLLIPSSDVTFGVALKSNPPIALSKYTNFVEKDNSPLIAALGFTNERFAKEDLGAFRSRMKEKHGTSTVVVQSGKTLVAHKKSAKLGELCENCSAPKAFSPPAEIRQERAADEGPSITFVCEVCGRQSYQRDRRNPLVSVEETGGDMKLATKLLRYMEYDLSDEVKPYLHTNWPSWYRRSERDLIVRGLERFDYTGVIEGLVNKTGSTYYNTLFNIAKRNNGGPLIKNRVQHQELAMLYSLCHNDLELIVAWPNATSSGKIDDFEKELEANGTIVYQKEVRLPRNGAEVLCMQMYAGESFLSKKQCQRKALASGWERTDKAMGAGRKLRVYLYYNDSENSLRGKAAKRKEELRSLFKTSDSDRKSYIHTADNAVQVTEYAQVFFNDNSINLLNNNDLDMLLPEKPYKTWLMMNSVKKYIQQELGSLFLLSSQIKSGSAAYLHGIRRTEDIDMMIDDRRLGPEVKQKMEAMKELMPWTDSSLAYSARDNEAKFWNFETYVPGKTFYEKRSEMIHNPKYHAYFCGLKVENAEAFLYMRMSRIAGDARPRPVADMLMLNEFMKEGRFKELKSKYKLIVPVGTLRKTVANRFYDKGGLQGWYKTVRYFIQERYKRKYTIEEIRDMLNAARTKTKPNPLDTDAIEERLLADVEGSFTDESETRRNPGGATIVITVPHALHAGPDVEQHWCDWSAAPAGRQIDSIMSKKHKTILHLADKKRTEIDYNRVASADTKWQYRLDDYIEKASMLLDIHSFPPDDVMWAGYDFVLFNSSEWPQQRQMEQAKLQDHLVKKGYKVFMDIADHRNYIQEKGIKAGIPSFLIEFNEELPLKDSCEDLIEGLEELLPKSNPLPGPKQKNGRKEPAKKFLNSLMGHPKMVEEFPDRSQRYAVSINLVEKHYGKRGLKSIGAKPNPVLPMKRHGTFPKSDYITEVPGEEEIHNEVQAFKKKHDALVQSIMKKDFSKTWTWNRPVAEDKKEAEEKALKKAILKADKELHDELCTKDDGKPCKNWYGSKRKRKLPKPAAWYEMETEPAPCKVGSMKVCRPDCYYCAIEQVKENPPSCPAVTQSLEMNTRNRNAAIKADYIQYGPLNLSDEDYWKNIAKLWNTTTKVAKKSRCANCVAFDISPRMLKCLPGPVSEPIEDAEGKLGMCWMHNFKCHSARSCQTHAGGGPITSNKVSYEWQNKSSFKANPTPHFFPGDAVIKYPWLKYANLIKTNPPRPVPKFGYHFTHEKNLKKIRKHGLWEDFNYLFYPDALYHAWVLGGHIDGMYDTPPSTRQPTEQEVMDALTKMVMLKVKVEPEQYRPVPYETGKLHDEFILEGNVSPSNIEVLGSVMETVYEDFKTNKVTAADVQEWAMGNNFPDPTKIIDGTFYNLLGHVKWYDDWKKSKHPKIIERLKENPSKDLYDVFEEWCSLVNMTNKELETFLNSNWGKVAGLSKQEAKNWNDIKSGRVSGRRILKMRKKIGFSGPNDQIKSQIDIGKAWEKALKNWTGPSDDSMKGETDWDWCKRQVRFNKRAGAFPYNQNAEERKGALVKKQKTQNQPSRRLLSLWVWGHDPWRWAYDNDVARMPKCPDTAWVGNKEKRKYGKIKVIAGPKKNFMMTLPYLYSQILRGVAYSEEGFVPKENPPIFPEPERISKVKGGRYKMDSGQDVSGLHFSDAVILGSDKSINVEWKNQEEEPEPKPAPKSGLRRIRFNMLRPSKFDGYKDAWIVASETSKGHIYSLSVEVQTTLTLKTFPGKKSEPRLRPETYGSLHPLNKIGEITIKSSGKKHPLYDRVFVMDSKENKKQPKNFHTKRARERSGVGRCVCGKIPYSSPQKAHAAASKEGRGVHPCEIKKGVWHTTSPRRNPIDPEYLKELNEELEDDYQDWTKELVPVPEMVKHGYDVETYPFMHKTEYIDDPTNDPDFGLKAEEVKKRALEDSMFDYQTEDGDWERTLSASEGRAQKILGLDEEFSDDYGRQIDYQTGEMRMPKTIEEKIVRDEQEELPFLDSLIQKYTEDPDEVPVFHPDFQKDLVRRNKGGGGSERLYGITKRYVRTLHPQYEPFTSGSLVERLKNRKVKQVESRQLGRVLSQLAREGQLVREIDNTYRNTERNYQEYLDEQEEPKANPRTKKGRKVPTRYLKGLNKTEMEIAKYEIDRGYEYDIDDPEAYEDWKSDIMAKARGMKTAPSRFKMKFIKKYGPLPEGKDLVSRLAKATGIKKKYIQKAYSKGLAAWRGGHRPGTSQHQWASGRAYALVMGAPTSTGKGKPDFKLAVEAGVRNEKGKLLI